MSVFHFRFILINLKIFGETVTTDCFIIFPDAIIVFIIIVFFVFLQSFAIFADTNYYAEKLLHIQSAEKGVETKT